jgi:hypothetical protein
LEKKRGAKAAFARGYRPAFSELYLRNEGGRRVHFRAGTDCPAAVRKAAAGLFDAERDGMLPDDRLGELEHFLTTVSKCGHELRAYDDALDFVAGRRDADRRAAKLEGVFPGGAADAALLGVLKVPLYPYQAEGALFAARVGRALIGDDMGLGKTIQAIAASEILARHFGVSKVLVICPTSLKHRWQSEIIRFSGREGENAARVIGGGRAQRQKDYALDDFCKITNYEKLKPDLDLIAAWSPELVIVDEAQRVKNWNTIAARALKRIDSSYAIVLTGTPLENKLEELVSIVQFVDQHRLGPTWKLLHEQEDRANAGAHHDPPAQIRGAAAIAEPRPEPAGADDREADALSPGKRRRGGENRPALAQNRVSVGQGSAAAHLCPAEHADVVQQHLPAGPGNRPWRQGRRIGGTVRRLVRRTRGQSGGVFVMDQDPRHPHPPPRSTSVGLRELPRRRAVGEAAGTGRAGS